VSFSLASVGMRYSEREVLSEVTLDLRDGELTAIVGPNGAGKSTLLGILGGLHRGFTGACRYRDRDIRKWPRRAFARSVSFVPQALTLEFPFTAGQVVFMGRAPHADGLFEGAEDRAAVEDAMRLTDTLEFHDRDFRSLSGGERQRVVLASALAQSPEFLLLDEPATFLDLRHQTGIYRLLRLLCERGAGVVAVTHDLNTALAYAERVIILNAGRVAADGVPRDALTPALVQRIFGVRAHLHGETKPWMVYEP
jgi:iron complex transport system ATP-binding protein